MEYERRLLSFIRAGDVEGLSRHFAGQAVGGVGRTAGTHLAELKNRHIITTTLVSRAAVEGGLSEDEAMSLSDRYVHRAETLTEADQVSALTLHMCLDYAKRVSGCAGRHLSPVTQRAMTYVRTHLNDKLDAATVAAAINVSRKTLSVHVKTDTGDGFAAYVRAERMRRARDLLAHTSYSISSIATMLGFPAQSNFQSFFRREAGVTPATYRRHAALPSTEDNRPLNQEVTD